MQRHVRNSKGRKDRYVGIASSLQNDSRIKLKLKTETTSHPNLPEGKGL